MNQENIEQPADNIAYDAAIREKGIQLLCGVDEAGRGPLAGPVYAAAERYRRD